MFDADRVREGLASTRFARLSYVRETDSTNEDAAHVLGMAAGGAVFLAEYQRHGRGRRGRQWVAPEGSALLFTAVLPEPLETAALWAVPFWSALAVADAVYAAAGRALTLQWPNDLLLGGRKVCGILSTSRVTGKSAWAACGIGLNVIRPADPGAEVDPRAAYLSDTGTALAREELLVAIVRALDASLPALRTPRGVAERWERRAGLPGTPYRILAESSTEPFDAQALRLGPEGELVVAAAGGERSIALGEARVLRD